MAYVGGDIFTVPDLDADRFNIWHLKSVLETYLDYPYNNFPNLFYKYDEESNEQIHGLLSDNDFKTMLKGLLSGKKKLHVFVDHEPDVPNEPVPIEVVKPMLLLQSPSEVEMSYKENLSQQQGPEAVADPPPQQQPHQAPHQQTQEPQQQFDVEENCELSDFEVTDGEEEDIFVGNPDDSRKWFHMSDTNSQANNGVDDTNDLDDQSYDSDNFDSLDSGEEEGEEGEGSRGQPRRRMRYPEWKKKKDISEKVELAVGLRFANPTEFKGALQLYAVQNSFDYKYLHNERKGVSAYCKKKCGWKIHSSWSPCQKYIQIKTFISEHNCGSHYQNKRATSKWAAARYLDLIRDQRDLKAKALQEMIRRDYNVELSKLSCHRAKKMALSIVDGRDGEQYSTPGSMRVQY